MTEERSIVFEFAMSGFEEKNLHLEFFGDYMMFSATAPDRAGVDEKVKYFKKRLKFKDVKSQKYYVPEDKFNRDKVKAVYKNGVLRVELPAKEEFTSKEGIKIEIVNEEGE